jgi:Tol biopolymer transport system component
VEKYDAFMPALSPDGRWLAYASNESGRYEIYVRPYPSPGAAVQVSQDGGTEPTWSADGRRLYFRDGRRMLVTQLNTTPPVTITNRRVLFTGTFDGDMPMPHRNYDVARDGRHFVMLAATPGTAPQTIVVLNWLTDFRARISSSVP